MDRSISTGNVAASGQMAQLLRIVQARDAASAWDCVETLRQTYTDFDYMAFGPIVRGLSETAMGHIHATDVCRNILCEYLISGLAKTDPWLKALASGVDYVSPTHDTPNVSYIDPPAALEAQQFFRSNGIDGHIALTVRMRNGAAYFFAAGVFRKEVSRPFLAHTTSSLPLMKLIATTFASKATLWRADSKKELLSRTEVGVLRHLGAGLLPEDIAQIERKSLSTVRNQIYAARQKLGAATVVEAVVRAERMGLL